MASSNRSACSFSMSSIGRRDLPGRNTDPPRRSDSAWGRSRSRRRGKREEETGIILRSVCERRLCGPGIRTRGRRFPAGDVRLAESQEGRKRDSSKSFRWQFLRKRSRKPRKSRRVLTSLQRVRTITETLAKRDAAMTRARTSKRFRAAGGDDPFGPVHRRAGEPADADSLQGVSDAAGAGEGEERGRGAIAKPLGFFRAKAANLMGMAKKLVEDYGGEIPQELEELITLPGWGGKRRTLCWGRRMGFRAGWWWIRMCGGSRTCLSDDAQ